MSFKKILSACLATMLVLGTTAVVNAEEIEDIAPASEEATLQATTFTSGMLTYEVTESKNVKITAIKDTATTITVPATIKNGSTTYNIVEIADGVGTGLEKLTGVNLVSASKLKKIGANCFSYCPALKKVEFPSTSVLASIGSNCFYYCPALETATNTNKLTSLTRIGASVFGLTPYLNGQADDFVVLGSVLLKYNGTDSDVTIPDGIVAISDAFFGKDVESIDFNDTEYIGSNAFYGCRSLTALELPAALTEIDDMAFSGCTNLKTVTYGNGLTRIGFCAFANCSSLASFKYVGTGKPALTYIGECAFWNCRKLYSLDTGALESINVGTFWNCFDQAPEEVGTIYYYRIPETVKTIAEGGYGNLMFTYVALPTTVEAIASSAFGQTEGAIYVTGKGSLAEEYFKNSGYTSVSYGDINVDGVINATDLKTIAVVIAYDLASMLQSSEKEADRDILNFSEGKGVIADIDGDGRVSVTDLAKIIGSIKADYEAAN